MPWNVDRSAQFIEKEVLKYSSADVGIIKSVVLDATDVGSWPLPTSREDRLIVPAGTILKLSATNTNQYVKYKGSGRIEGILAHSVELYANATDSDEPAPMFFHQCVFATPAIVDFTTYASALVSTLNTCKFE